MSAQLEYWIIIRPGFAVRTLFQKVIILEGPLARFLLGFLKAIRMPLSGRETTSHVFVAVRFNNGLLPQVPSVITETTPADHVSLVAALSCEQRNFFLDPLKCFVYSKTSIKRSIKRTLSRVPKLTSHISFCNEPLFSGHRTELTMVVLDYVLERGAVVD